MSLSLKEFFNFSYFGFKFWQMTKYKAKPLLRKKDNLSVQEKKEEAKFFKVAIIITIILILLMYLVYSSF